MIEDKFADEMLTDDELDKVVGGYADENIPGDRVRAVLYKHGFKFIWNDDKPDEYIFNGKSLNRDEAFKEYQKLYDKGVFSGIPAANRYCWGDDRTDVNPACMSAAFINGEITGGEDF